MAKGKIVFLQGAHIQLPDVPDDKSEILFSEYPKAQQYWRRQEYSKYFYDYIPYTFKRDRETIKKTQAFAKSTVYDSDGRLVSLSEEHSLIVQRELRQENYRRKYGVYAYMNGELVYVAPDYYYNLQWCQMKDLAEKYGHFREVQNDWFIFYDWAKVQDWITAIFMAKCKKSGLTQVLAGACLNEASLLEGAELLAASKDFPHVKDVFMAYVFHAYDNLPMIMQPMQKKRNLSELVFGKPVQSQGGASHLDGKFLNSRISGQKTKATCFDGPVVKRGFFDEFPKTWESSGISPQQIYSKTIETVKLQQKKNGIIVYFSYLPEKDDRGYNEFKILCQQSTFDKRDPITGQTPTGGILYLINALESNEQCFDIYGKCDQKKAYKLVTDEKNTKQTREDKQAHQRQYPTCYNDFFDSSGKGKTFDNMRLAIAARELEKLMKAKVPYRLCNLRWENSAWESGIKAERRPQGKFCNVYVDYLTEDETMYSPHKASLKTFQDIPKDLQNIPITKNERDDDGFLLPDLDNVAVGSFDPSDYVLKSDVVEFSQNAGHGGYIFDPKIQQRGIRTNALVYEYFFRHDDPDDTLEDLVKIILFFGVYIIIEANKKWIVTAIKKEGLHHFLLLRQKDGTIKPYTEGDENDLVNTTTDMTEAYCRAINRYLIAPKSTLDQDQMMMLCSLVLILQLMNFEVLNTKKYDLVVSFGYWRLAVESFSVFIDELRRNSLDDGGGMQQMFDDLLM